MITLDQGFLFGNRYEIIRCVGAGGMGAVYLACDPNQREFLVALKVLYPGVIRTPETRERFRNEIVASYRVNHRNVVRAYEYFDREDFQAYAMEYVNGGDLSDKMEIDGERVRLQIPEVINILHQMASGIEAIHNAGIVHRDLKPENILLAQDGTLKISDFGVARLKGSVTLTADGAMVGTPKYVSPEYVETGTCDGRGDIYAVGLMGYELATGASPFQSDSRVSIMMERFSIDPEDLARKAPDCPRGLIQVIKKAMSVDVSERYESAQHLKHDLDLVGAGKEPVFAVHNVRVLRSSALRVEPYTVQSRVKSPVPRESNKTRLDLARIPSSRLGRKIFTGMGFIAALLVVAAGLVINIKGNQLPDSAFAQVPEGVYRGSAAKLFSSTPTPFMLWKNDTDVFVLVGEPSCTLQQLSSRNTVSCGGLQFEFTVDSPEALRGTVRELGWNIRSSWSMKKYG